MTNLSMLDRARIRTATLDRFANWKIRANVDLPLLPDDRDLSPPSAEQVARRGVAMGYLIGLYYQVSGADLLKSLRRFDLLGAISTRESVLLSKKTMPEDERISTGWYPESVQIIAWSLNLAGLSHFESCDDELADLFPLNVAPDTFVKNARLRPKRELLEEADVLYMLHWASNDALLNRRPPRANPFLVQFRRHAIEWIIGVSSDWDDISLDT